MWSVGMSYVWFMSPVDKSCLTRMSHVSYKPVVSLLFLKNETRRENMVSRKPLWVMSHMYESCRTWMSHVSYRWVMSLFFCFTEDTRRENMVSWKPVQKERGKVFAISEKERFDLKGLWGQVPAICPTPLVRAEIIGLFCRISSFL